jgi:hypothetical protein
MRCLDEILHGHWVMQIGTWRDYQKGAALDGEQWLHRSNLDVEHKCLLYCSY